jgi:hypothetical protein
MRDKTNILDEQGYFWWKGEPILQGHFAPENYVTGRLYVEDDGAARLELDGMLPATENSLEANSGNDSTKRVPRPIQGLIKTTGQHVLLVDAIGNGGSFSTNRFSYEKFFATMCLVGHSEFPRKSTLPLSSKFEVNLSGFEDWLRLGTIEIDRTRRTLVIKSKNVRDVCFYTDAGRLKLSHYSELPGSGRLHIFELTLREFNILSWVPKKGMTFEQVKDEFGVLQDLMILLTDSHHSLAWPTIQLSRTKKIYTFYFRRVTSSASPPGHLEMPTNFPQLKDKFGDIFSAWRNKRGEFGAGFHSYIATRRDVQLYVENRFITLVQGLESFHRTKSEKSVEPSPIQEKISRILSQVELKKDKSWLMNMLRHAAEPRLSERLAEILSALPFGLDSDRIEKFAGECADIRNDLAHFGGQKTREKSSDYLVEISEKSEALAFFYQMTLWREIGIADQHLRSWLYESFRSFRLKHILVAANLLSPKKLQHRHVSNDTSVREEL